MKRLHILIPLLALLFATTPVAAEEMAATVKTVLAGGCFWCMEADFEKLDGVVAVISGFTGGEVENPTYRGNHAGHYEAVEITYDTSKLSYLDILDHYWSTSIPLTTTASSATKDAVTCQRFSWPMRKSARSP